MNTGTLLEETERFLHEQIPLTQAMGVRLEAFNDEELRMTAPLEPNHNHLGTAFGGSLSAIATLAGYALLWLELGDRSAHIVVRESSINYQHPVRGDIRAKVARLDSMVLADFKRRFQKSGKATISLAVSIEDGGRVCVNFTGTYVALAVGVG